MYEFAHNFFYDQETFVMTLLFGAVFFVSLASVIAVIWMAPPPPARPHTPPLPPKYKDPSQ